LLGLSAITETLQRLVDESHPTIEIANEWLLGLRLDTSGLSALWVFIPSGMELLLDTSKCWPFTDTPRYFDSVLKIKVDKVIQRIYRIVGHTPFTNTWTAKWVD
jgi:hypothetical protein